MTLATARIDDRNLAAAVVDGRRRGGGALVRLERGQPVAGRLVQLAQAGICIGEPAVR